MSIFVESMSLANGMVSLMSIVDNRCWKRDGDVCSTLNNCCFVIHDAAISKFFFR